MLGSLFGMMNLFSRPSGGLISDLVAKRWGMRGRLWALWIIQTLGGVCCVLLGLSSHSLPVTMAVLIIFSIFCQQSCGLSFGVVVRALLWRGREDRGGQGERERERRAPLCICAAAGAAAASSRRQPPACISNSALTPHQSHHTRHITHHNAQPFVSKRATGLVSGFVGAGGNMGGAITQAVFFTYAPYPADKAFIYMGIMSIVSRAWLGVAFLSSVLWTVRPPDELLPPSLSRRVRVFVC